MVELQRSAVTFTVAELERLNRWPIGVLAGVGIAAGADAASAIVRAQQLIGEHGTSRRIDGEHAERLVLAMQQWAAQV